MARPSSDKPVLPAGKVIRGGVQLFIVCSIIGIVLGIWWKRPAGIGEVLANINWSFAALLLPMLFADYWLGGWRYSLFFNGRELPYISQRDCMRSNWANMFMGAATPFQTGGAPAQLFILWRKGATIADSLLVSTVNYIATLVFFLTASLIALAWLPANLFGQNFAAVFKSAFLVIACVVSLVLIILLLPGMGRGIVRSILSAIPLGRERKQKLLEKAELETTRFHDGFRRILQGNKRGVALTILATLLLYFNKYLMAYVLISALGQQVSFEVFIGIQIIQMLMLYFAPTPGASGLAEISSVWLMGKLMPESLLVIYTVLHRLVTTILAAAIGAVVLMEEVNEEQNDGLTP
jgi:uncharacterized protein (TIRG00374 family)